MNQTLSRREAIQRILVATALSSTLKLRGFAADLATPGIGFDPNLLKKEIPWPRLLTDAEKRTVSALADVIIPEDEFGPAASAAGVPDFLDEWVSAPYEPQVKDRQIIRDGLAWLEGEAKRRFQAEFASLPAEQQTTILSDVVTEGTAAHREAHGFFLLFRDRIAGGYYTTPAGWKALGYTGNMPMAEFPNPPHEALVFAGLA